jgi:hypothetical protein
MIATSRDYRLKAVDCEEHAKAASDPAVIKEWQALAMRWRSMALQASNEMLVGPLRDGLTADTGCVICPPSQDRN